MSKNSSGSQYYFLVAIRLSKNSSGEGVSQVAAGSVTEYPVLSNTYQNAQAIQAKVDAGQIIPIDGDLADRIGKLGAAARAAVFRAVSPHYASAEILERAVSDAEGAAASSPEAEAKAKAK